MTTDVRRRSVAGNAAVLMASQLVTWGVAVALAVILPRYLGPAALGRLRLGVSLWTVAGVVVVFGTGTLLTKAFARDPGRAAGRMASAATVQLLAYVASCVAVAAFVLVAGYDRDVVTIVAIIGVSMLFEPFVSNGRAALSGLERMERVAIVDVASKTLYAVAIVVLIALGADVFGIAAAAVVPAVASAVGFGWFLRRFGVGLRPRLRGAAEVAAGSRQYLAISFALVAYQQVDIVVISLLVADRTLGWYSTADTLFSSLLFVPTILMTSLFPAMSRLHLHDRNGAIAMVGRSAKVLVLAAVPIGFGTIALAAPVAVLLFGPAFAGTAPVLAVLGVVLVLTYLTILLGRYAIAIDRERFWLRLMVAAVVATVLLDIVLVPWADRAFGNGAIGGAVAYVLTEAMMLGVGVWKIAPELLTRGMARRVVRCVVAGGVMLAVVWPLRHGVLAVPIAVGALTYVGVAVALQIPDPDERVAMRALIDRALRRRRPQPDPTEVP